MDVESHKEIEFIDVFLDCDTKLFIDSYLIECSDDIWCKESNRIIKDFFSVLTKMYKFKKSKEEKLSFLNHSHEINATKLGYGDAKHGKACGSEKMLEYSEAFERLIDKGMELEKLGQFVIFTKGFAEDKLSDMLSNILFYQLNSFTLEQCAKLRIETSLINKPYSYWLEESGWNDFYGECLMIKNELILLVTKRIVSEKFEYTASDYLKKEIIKAIQDSELEVRDRKIRKPTQKSIEKKPKSSGESNVELIIKYTLEDNEHLRKYDRRLIENYTSNNLTISDDELDILLKK